MGYVLISIVVILAMALWKLLEWLLLFARVASGGIPTPTLIP